MTTPRPLRAVLPGVGAALLVLAGCSTSVTLDQAEVEKQITSELTKAGVPADGTVTCPGDLDGVVGTTMACDVDAGDGGVGGARVDLEVTDVDGTDVGFDYTLVPLIGPEYIEQQVSEQLTQQVGQAPDDVSCPDSLDGVEGETTTCVLSAGSDTIDVDVTVSSVDGSDFNLDIQVADAVN